TKSGLRKALKDIHDASKTDIILRGIAKQERERIRQELLDMLRDHYVSEVILNEDDKDEFRDSWADTVQEIIDLSGKNRNAIVAERPDGYYYIVYNNGGVVKETNLTKGIFKNLRRVGASKKEEIL